MATAIPTTLRVLELYSGIGGMHWALRESGVKYEVVMAVDINTTANSVYKQNFPDVNLQSFGLEKLSLQKLESLNVNTILMSPPCQPFTRVGKKGDCEDVRTKSFLHILHLLREIGNKPDYILVENVKGFESSLTRHKLVECLEDCNYFYQEFLLTPLQFGIPNCRLRYYLIARFNEFFSPPGEILTDLPGGAKLKSKTKSEDSSNIITETAAGGVTINETGHSESCLTNERRHKDFPLDSMHGNCEGHQEVCVDDPRNENTKHTAQSAVTHKSDFERQHSENKPSTHGSNDTPNSGDLLRAEPSKGSSIRSISVPEFSDPKLLNALYMTDLHLSNLKNAGRSMRYCEEDDEFIDENSLPLSDFMETGPEEQFKDYLLSDKELRMFVVMDIVFPALKKSTCFTKRYGHYIEGAGSVVQMSTDPESVKAASYFKSCVVELKNRSEWGENELAILRKLKLRYFTPREEANLLCFPAEFEFPDGLSNLQKYRVLGNSLNVHVVSELIKVMTEEPAT